MKNYVLSFLASVGMFTSFAQEYSCQHAKSTQSNVYNKSGLLSPHEINLTEKYDVYYYKLDVNVERTSEDIDGTVEMRAKVRNSSMDTILFELHPFLTITDIRLNGSTIAFDRVNTAVIVKTNLAAGTDFKLEIDYGGTPPNSGTDPNSGGAMSNETSPYWGGQVTWTLSEPFYAYEWFPCKQSLRDKIDSVDIWVTTDISNKVGSNGLLANITDMGNGKHRYEWKNRYPIDYYLISIAVSDYQEYSYYVHWPEDYNDSMLVQNYLYNNQYILNFYKTKIDNTGNYILALSQKFGKYPFWNEKYGHAMGEFGGGMEHQTMTTLIDFGKSLVVHELAHQWFGDLVTCSSWADIWVNEGFAAYAEYLMEEGNPTNAASLLTDLHDAVMQQPGGSVWVEDSLNMSRIFSGRLTYNKGGAIIHTMRHIINNDSLFYAGLQNYLDTYKYGTASGLELQAIMETTSGVSLTNFMQEWYFGEGYPTYSARWNQINDQLFIELSQTTSTPSVTPLFTTPVEFQFTRDLGDTIIRMNINNSTQFLQIPIQGVVTNLSKIDPKNYIINDIGTITHDPSLSVASEVKTDSEIKIYPNPTDGPLNIEFPTSGNYTIKVVNAEGKLVETYTLNNTNKAFIQLVDKGWCMLQIEDVDQRIITRKIIKR
ncbi:MAG: T9SS type A sorting domain-containing protein [Brumimicrobium sp.]|nr:T9SS type A sorting domain-containing protein [Brumimicrobium sp.]MCO5269282.1 T9SS type A sorting domain-containing protein [Brumimicrobium sp.]